MRWASTADAPLKALALGKRLPEASPMYSALYALKHPGRNIARQERPPETGKRCVASVGVNRLMTPCDSPFKNSSARSGGHKAAPSAINLDASMTLAIGARLRDAGMTRF